MSKPEDTEASSFQDPACSDDTQGAHEAMVVESTEGSSYISPFDTSQKVVDSGILKSESDLKASSNMPILSNASIVSPIIIGNLGAASALSSVFQNQEVVVSKALLSPSTLTSNTVSAIPVFLTSNNIIPSAVQSNQYANEGSFVTVNERKNSSEVMTSVRGNQSETHNQANVNPVVHSVSKPSLSSSDTVIIAPESSNMSNMDKALANVPTVCYDLSDKKLSLISNISERSVSLESIPSISLFRPDAHPVSESGVGGEESFKGITVVGSGKMPAWLLQLMKKQNISTVSNSDNEPQTIDSFPTVQVNACLQDKSASVDENQQNEQCDNKDDKTESSVICCENSISKKDKEKSLERSDTVILVPEDPKLPAKASSGQENVHAPTIDQLPPGFSFGSLSTVSADPATLAEEQSIEDYLTARQTSEISSAINNFLNSNGSISQILYPVKVTSDPLRLGLVADGEKSSSSSGIRHFTFGCSPQTPSHSVGNSSVVMVCGNSAPRAAQAKETQTDMVLGTSNVYFKAVDYMPGCSGPESNHLPATVLTMSVPSSASGDTTTQVIQPKLVIDSQAVPVSSTFPASTASLVQPHIDAVPRSGLPSQEFLTPGFNMEAKTRAFKCEACEERFSSKEDLVLHKKTHKSFKCDLCNATFTRMGNYTRHRKIHSLHAENQNGFRCEDCGREFLQRCDLKRHFLIHTKQEPYRCDVCSKGYIRRSDLIVHMRFHNKDRAFPCSYCSKKFYQSGDLNRHVRKAHKPESELTCGHCDRKYACESTLIRHMKAIHKDIILQAVDQRLQALDPNDKTATVTTKDVLFTMKQK